MYYRIKIKFSGLLSFHLVRWLWCIRDSCVSVCIKRRAASTKSDDPNNPQMSAKTIYSFMVHAQNRTHIPSNICQWPWTLLNIINNEGTFEHWLANLWQDFELVLFEWWTEEPLFAVMGLNRDEETISRCRPLCPWSLSDLTHIENCPKRFTRV